MYAIDCIFTKSSDWSYEKEWRVVASKKDDETEFNSNVKISRIILGANISDSDEKVLVSIANDKGIPIYKMSIDNSFYKLNLLKSV